MASKAPFKVHSLTKHIQDANKSRMSSSQPGHPRADFGSSKTANPIVFDNDSDNTSSDADDDGDDDGTNLLARLFKDKRASTLSKTRPVKTEIADSDEERVIDKAAQAVGTEEANDSHPKDAASPKPGLQEAPASTDALKAKLEPKSESTSPADSNEDESNNEAASSATENKNPAKGHGKRARPDQRNKQPSPPALKKEVDESATTSSSSASSSDSDSDDDDDDDDKSKGSQASSSASDKEVSGHETHDSSDESDSSSDDSDAEDETAEEQKATRGNLAPTVPEHNNSSESEVEAADESIHMEHRSQPQEISLPSLNSSNFELRKSNDGASGRDIARICSEANMQGKHFWYFTVPSNVPVSVVQNMEIPMDQDNGQNLFSHDGQDHGIVFNSPRSSYQILIPAADGSDYQPASHRVENTVQIRRIINLSSQNLAIAQPQDSTPHPRPEVLQSTRPVSIESSRVLSKKGKPPKGKNKDSVPVEAAVVEAAAVEAAAVPAAKNQNHASLKGKNKYSVPVEAAAVPAAKNENHVPLKGKRKLTGSDQDAAAAASQLQAESQTAESKKKKRRTDRNVSLDLGSDPSTPAQVEATSVPPPISGGPLPISGDPLDATKVPAPPPAPTQKRKPGRPRKDQTAVPSKAVKRSKAPATAKTTPRVMTPVPAHRQTPVPPPIIPTFARSFLRSSPVSASTPAAKSSSQATKAGEKQKAAAPAHQSPPPSAQAPSHKVTKNVLDSQRPPKPAA
ncbi:hypothetical protein CDD82_2250 [Ophiocordyceps australis]|uniref:DNA-directed RNA polymerase I subunit RPA34.5 n=1 Tax=Ophiocordyceps australis TaxID=1399860 RepID=A0A2C5ZF34_9HYPO|nr:hypothetical protein CDD82_2250 [Ophiocordyceps australis]